MPNPLSACVVSSALALGAAVPAAGGGAPAPAAPASAPPVSEADARRLHKLAENWLELGEVPADSAAELFADRVVGVAVTLRLKGAAIGHGEAVRPDLLPLLDGAAPGPADAAALLRKAAAEAFARAKERLKDAFPGEANPLAAAAPALCVEVQVGHAPSPVLLPAEAPAGKDQPAKAAEDGGVFAQWAPGWHGLALRPAPRPGAEAAPAIAWPGAQMAEGLSSDAVVRRLLAAQNLDEGAARRLARPGGPRLWVFEVVDMVRPVRALPPMPLVRGTALTPESAIDAKVLRALAERMAAHLAAKTDDKGALKGGYRPALDQWLPAEAPPAEAALAAYALVREGARRLADNPADEAAMRSLKAAAALLKKLGPVVSDAKAAPQPLAGAFVLLALADAPGGADRDLRDRLAADLLALDAGEGGGYVVPVPSADPSKAEQAKAVNDTTAAIITCALAAWYERTRDAKAEAVVGRQLARAFAKLAERGEAPVEVLYWLALAERRAGVALSAASKEPEKAAAAHADRLSQLAKQLEAFRAAQILRAPEGVPADVVGGFSFGQPGLALPTWRGAFVMGLWGQLLREEAAIPSADRGAHWRPLTLGSRFMAQLMATPATCYACRNPGAALGGVRGAPWETALDTQPTAMTLLALEEVIAAAGQQGK